MNYFAVGCFVAALAAALLGIAGVGAGVAALSESIFFAFLAVSAVTFVMSMVRTSSPDPVENQR